MSDPDPSFALLVERLLDGSIVPDERARLATLVRDDVVAREELRRQVADSLRLQTTLSAFDAEDTWLRVRMVLARNTGSQRIRSADAVQARLRAASDTANRRPSRRSGRVSARLPRRRGGPALAPLVASIAAAVCLLAAVWLVGAPTATPTAPQLARLVLVQGQVVVERDGRSLAGAADMALAAGDRVRVSSGRADVALARGDSVQLAAGADLALTGPGSVRLAAGSLVARVVPRAAGDAIAFQTPHATAEILGTTFTLDVAAARTRLDVASGKVRLRRATDAAAVVVGADEWAEAGPGRELVARRREPEPAAGPAVVSFSLVDGATNQPVPGYEQLRDGMVVERRRLPRYTTVFARTQPETVARVTFAVDGDRGIPDQRTPPYSFTRWDGKTYENLPLVAGEHTLEAWAHADTRAPAAPGSGLRITIRVVE